MFFKLLFAMTNLTLSISKEIYERMKRHPEVKWSEIARRAILDYLAKIEGIVSSEDLLRKLGEDFEKDLDNISIDDIIKYYRKMREEEWRRLSTIQGSL